MSTKPIVIILSGIITHYATLGAEMDGTPNTIKPRIGYISGKEIEEIARIAQTNHSYSTFHLTNWSEPAIGKVLPDDYSRFQKVFRHDYGTNDAATTVALMHKARELRGHVSESVDQKADSAEAYRASWRLCLRVWKRSSDPVAKNLILDVWNESLSGSTTQVVSQLYALSMVWDRAFLTEKFWQMWEETKDKMIISAASYLFYRHGEERDKVRFSRKLDSGLSSDLEAKIREGILWMERRQRGMLYNPDDPAVPPRMEY